MEIDSPDSDNSHQIEGICRRIEENNDAIAGFRVPDNIVEDVASILVTECNDPREALFNLASMCCVCRQWRTVACKVDQDFPVVLDSFTGNRSPSGCLSLRFKRQPLEKKIRFFLGVVQLFRGVEGDGLFGAPVEMIASRHTWQINLPPSQTEHSALGYRSVSLTGEGINDDLLLLLCHSTRRSLHRISINSTGAVSDKAITILVLMCSGLQHFCLDNVHMQRNGIEAFLGCLLQTCSDLRSLYLNNLGGFDPSASTLNIEHWNGTQLRSLHMRGLNDRVWLGWIWPNIKLLEHLSLDGRPENVVDAAASCKRLASVSYVVSKTIEASYIIACVESLPLLQTLEFLVKGCKLSVEQLAIVGRLPVTTLKVDSYQYKCQPCIGRSFLSHVDNEGVRALANSLYQRKKCDGKDIPISISLCGASSLSHEAVGSILLLPLLTGLDVSGCGRLNAMDKMRLVSKVKAGRAVVSRSSWSDNCILNSSKNLQGCFFTNAHL